MWPGYETKVLGDLHKILCFTVIVANTTGEPSTLVSYPGHVAVITANTTGEQ